MSILCSKLELRFRLNTNKTIHRFNKATLSGYVNWSVTIVVKFIHSLILINIKKIKKLT